MFKAHENLPIILFTKENGTGQCRSRRIRLCVRHRLPVEVNDAANTFTPVHQIKGLVDVLEAHGVSDEIIEFEFARQITLDVLRQFGASLNAAKCGATPDTTCHELKRPGTDFLARTGNTDNDGLAPALVAALERRAHDIHIANTLERIIHAAIGELNDDLLNGLIVIVRVNAVGSTELARQFKFLLVNVHRNNPARLRLRGTNDGRQANAANAKNGYGSAFLNFGGVRYSAHASGHAAAEQADLFQRCFLIHLGQGYFGQHGVFRKG